MRKVEDIQENMARCLCGGCPTFPGDGGFYCAKGKSGNLVDRRGCMCGGCENFKLFDLKDGYYCAAGLAGEEAQ
jgi:hypothetical protein